MSPLLCYYELISGQNAHNDKSVYFIRCPRTALEMFFLQKKYPFTAHYAVRFFMGVVVIVAERLYKFLSVSSGCKNGHVFPAVVPGYTGENTVSKIRSFFFGT